MKSVFLSVVALLTCSECVIGDLEFYPDYKRSEGDVSEEEWVKEPAPLSDLQRYLQQVSSIYRPDRERSSYPFGGLLRGKTTKPVDPSWPSTLGRHLFNNKDLALRLLQRNEKPQGPSRKQYFKILPSGRDVNVRVNPFLQNEDASAILSLFNTNADLPKDDIHLNEDDSDFNFSNDESDVGDDEEEGGEDHEEYEGHEEDVEHAEHIGSDDSAHKEEDRPNLPTYDVDNVLQPDEFAFTPSDPRYLNVRDAVKPETLTPALKTTPYDDVEYNDVESYLQKQRNGYGDITDGYQQPDAGVDVVTQKSNQLDDTAEMYITAVVAGISAAASVALIAFGIGWYNLQKHVKNASDAEYPAYGITGPNKDVSPSGDRRLAQSAQMYHYQHQKQQIIAMERAAANERHGSVSEAESDEENEEGDYTVYECPGLAPTGEMEVKNPLFQDDPTPAQTPAVKSSEDGVVSKK